MIPADAEKPADPRREKKLPQQLLSSDLAYVIAATTVPMASDDPDSILNTATDCRQQLQYVGELAYLRGDFQRVMRCFSETEGGEAARLRACPTAIAAAISTGDYSTYKEFPGRRRYCGCRCRTCACRHGCKLCRSQYGARVVKSGRFFRPPTLDKAILTLSQGNVLQLHGAARIHACRGGDRALLLRIERGNSDA
ncbi:MAG: hypothetical protein ACOYJC_05865 [Christensenellales bacterium]|jgi:hypothetical protein